MRRGELSAAAAEYLIPFAKYPVILDAMARAFAKWPMSLLSWKAALSEAVMLNSRSMDPEDPTGPRFDLTEENLKELEYLTYTLRPGDTRQRALNVELWDRLQDEASVMQTRPAVKSNGSVKGRAQQTLPVRQNGHQDAPQRGDDPDVLTVDDGDFQAIVERYERDRLRGLIVERLEQADVTQLDAVCDVLDINPLVEWSLTAGFLRLLPPERLDGLAAELGIDVAEARTTAEVIALLQFEDPLQTPECILQAHNLDLEPVEV